MDVIYFILGFTDFKTSSFKTRTNYQIKSESYIILSKELMSVISIPDPAVLGFLEHPIDSSAEVLLPMCVCCLHRTYRVGKRRDCLVGTPIVIVPLRNEGKKCYKLTLYLLHVLYQIYFI